MDPEYSARLLSVTAAAATAAPSPQSVLHTAFEAIIRGDFEAFGRWVTDDVELSIRGLGEMDGDWQGRDRVIAAARKNFALLAEQKPEIEGMIAEGDRIAVLLRESGVFQKDGRPYRVRAVQWFTFAGGQIRRIDEIVAASAG